jgi:hypothetical protein
MPEGCEERLSLAFIGWTLAWRRRTRSAMRALESAPGFEGLQDRSPLSGDIAPGRMRL